jgi:hypothetical protein
VVPFIHVTLVFMLNMARNRMASATLKEIVNINHFRQAGRLLSAVIHSAICCRPLSMSFQSSKQNTKASDKLVPRVGKSPENDDFCQSAACSLSRHDFLAFPERLLSQRNYAEKLCRETMQRNYAEKLCRETMQRNYAEKLCRETMQRNYAEKLRRETTFVEKLPS